jgi:invasion protein IalB
LVAAVVAMLMGLEPDGGYVAPATATPLDAWEMRCVSEDQSDQEICATEIHKTYGGRDFIFYFARGPKGPVPFVAVSEGAPFRRMSVKVDEETPIDADRCEQGMCFFKADKSKKLVQLFRKGKAAHIEIKGPEGVRLFDAEITLYGFTSAYKRYR